MKITLLLVAVAGLCQAQHVILLGGGDEAQNEEGMDKFIELAGGVGVAKIGLITTASSDPPGSADALTDMFVNTFGALSCTYIPVTETSGNADDPEIETLLREQTGFFFSGGDQARIVAGWKTNGQDSNGMQVIKELFPQGYPISGTSAGTAVQGDGPMLEGGLSWNGLNYGAYDGGYNPDYPDDLAYSMNSALGIVPGIVFDSHYSERGREGRLIQLLMDTDPNLYGFGIDETCGIYINLETGDAEVMDNNYGVMVVDTRGASLDERAPSRIANVRISFFTEDDIFNIYTGEVTFASWKVDNSGNEQYTDAISSDNIFSHPDKPSRDYGEFRETARRLWDSADTTITSYSWRTDEQFTVNMNQLGGTAFGGNSPITGDFVLSYSNMLVNIDYLAANKN